MASADSQDREIAMIKFRRATSFTLAIALLTLAGCRSELPPPSSKPADEDPSALSAQVASPKFKSRSLRGA